MVNNSTRFSFFFSVIQFIFHLKSGFISFATPEDVGPERMLVGTPCKGRETEMERKEKEERREGTSREEKRKKREKEE